MTRYGEHTVFGNESEMLRPQQQSQIVRELVIQHRDIHFSVISHATVVEIGGPDSCPQIVNDRYFGVHIDGTVHDRAVYLGPGGQAKSANAPLYSCLRSLFPQAL